MKFRFILAIAAVVGFSSCVGDLNVEPIDPNLTLPEDVLNSEEAYAQVLAKCYAGLTVSSSKGPDDNPDIDGIDGGYGQYLRAIFYNNELPTDEAVICWNDKTVLDLHSISWTTSDVFVNCMFSRIYYQIGLCNEFIRRASASGFNSETMKTYIAEARALRLLSYLHAIDMFGNVPFATEHNSVGSTGPDRITRADLFNWMDKECDNLIEEGKLLGFKQNVYGRLDVGFVKMIQAKLNLNAAVYLGISDSEAKPYFDKVGTICKEIKEIYPTLYSEYTHLFMADNHLRTDEIIFNVPQDADFTRNYGGTNFLVKASVKGGDAAWKTFMGVADDGWGGIMVTPEFLAKFDEQKDKRFLFWGGGPSPEDGEWPRDIADVKDFTTGWTSYKFRNVSSDGSPAPKSTISAFCDVDYPLFRAADAYLMMAEAQLRGATTVSESEAKEAWNAVRTRAGLDNLTGSQYSLDELLDERGRELYWEGWRRSDLIRFNKFTSGEYNWAWKGNVKEGTSVDSKYVLMPIPANEINSNNKLVQNPGY